MSSVIIQVNATLSRRALPPAVDGHWLEAYSHFGAPFVPAPDSGR
jgi:hypothetical protein